VRPGGAATFNVPIRTLALVQEGEGWQASYGVGSGVTVYADPQAESLELAAKARLHERVSEPFELLETLRLEAGHYGRQERHLARMCESARYFGRAWPAQALQDALARVAQAHPQGLWRVRLLLGEGGAVNAQAFPLAPTTEPVRVALAPQPLDTRGGQHEFILHKTTRRRHYEALAPQDPALFDSLLVNERGEVTEFTRGNLALRLDGRWQTPALACGLLAGTYRAELLAQGRLEEAVFSVDDVRRADALVFFNSLRGWLRAELVPEAPG
jgi:para-aminobenzoate synthetase/4-amino-4-deoxychorismate lyase